MELGIDVYTVEVCRGLKRTEIPTETPRRVHGVVMCRPGFFFSPKAKVNEKHLAMRGTLSFVYNESSVVPTEYRCRLKVGWVPRALSPLIVLPP